MVLIEEQKKTSPSSNASGLANLSNKSFEETYKLAYSHGLESIYAIETIDLKSVRRIESKEKAQTPKLEKTQPITLISSNELDLGNEFRNWIVPFISQEPIQVLNLSKHTEKCLIENKKFILADLIDSDLKEFVSIRGMGQGHIEEIRLKLKEYTDGIDLKRSNKIDFLSWTKCLIAMEDRKKAYVFLQKYDLQDIISLTPGETVEVKKLTLERRQECFADIQKILEAKREIVLAQITQVFEVFIKPWINRRNGFATHEEILERFSRISINADASTKVLQLLEDLYFEEGEFLSVALQKIDVDVYATSPYHEENYQFVVTKALSYFYSPNVFYLSDELILLLKRELAANWVGYQEGYLEKILKICPLFCFTKGMNQQLEIHKI